MFSAREKPTMIPHGQDMAQILSKFWLHYLRLMALPVMKESSYLDTSGYFRSFSLSSLVSPMSDKSVIVKIFVKIEQ